MYSGIQPDFFEKWLPRRATLQVVIGVWMAGFAVAGATVWRMDHPTARTHETRVISPEVAAAPTEAVSDMAGSERPLVYARRPDRRAPDAEDRCGAETEALSE